MKMTYETPMMFVEEFIANTAVALCTVNGGINYTFDCMAGPNTDTANVIADAIAEGCKTKIGYAPGYNKAVDLNRSSSTNHSNNNSSVATWGSVNGKLSVTYSGKVDGLLYTDSGTNGTRYWSVNESAGYVQHSTSNGGTHHQVAPVINSYSVKASW